MRDNYLFGKILVVLHHINRMDKIVSKYGNVQVQTWITQYIYFALSLAYLAISVDSGEESASLKKNHLPRQLDYSKN